MRKELVIFENNTATVSDEDLAAALEEISLISVDLLEFQLENPEIEFVTVTLPLAEKESES